MFPFHGVDYMEIDAFLSDEEKLVRQTVREFADNEVIPHIEGWFREGKFPKHLVATLGEMGFWGPTSVVTVAPKCPTCSTAW